jgi:predicted molibdopterin-dependent oxidoreductase YjgC
MKEPNQTATSPKIGGGLPIIQDWAKHTLHPEGAKIWQTLFHKSACLACAWGTGGQKALIETDRIDLDYLRAHTDNWQAIADGATVTDWEQITTTCGVDRSAIVAAAEIIATSNNVVFAWAMGVTQQVNGVDNIHSIANTAQIDRQSGTLAFKRVPVVVYLPAINL